MEILEGIDKVRLTYFKKKQKNKKLFQATIWTSCLLLMQIYDKYWLLHNWFLCSIKADFDAEKMT